MFGPGTNQHLVYYHFDFRFRFSVLFGRALKAIRKKKIDVGHRASNPASNTDQPKGVCSHSYHCRLVLL